MAQISKYSLVLGLFVGCVMLSAFAAAEDPCYLILGGGVCEAPGDCSCINAALADTNCGTVVMNSSVSNAGAGLAQSCVLFPRDNVALDCNGQTIDGVYGTFSIAVNPNSKSNITVSNCVLKEWDFGIAQIASLSRFINNTIYDNTYEGIYLVDGSNNTIQGNDIFNNKYGVGLTFSDNATLVGNNIMDNAEEGIYMEATSTGNSVTSNYVCSNGLDIKDLDSNSGDNNTCQSHSNWNDTGYTGCQHPCPCYAYRAPSICEAPGDCDCITEALADSYCDIVELNESVTDDPDTCVTFPASNKTLDCKGYTIDGSPSTYRIDGVNIAGWSNTVVKNCVISNFTYGIYLGGSDNSALTNNTLTENYYVGIELNGSSNSNVTGNSVSRLGTYHISQLSGGAWEEKYVEHFPRGYATKEFSFAPVGGAVTLRAAQVNTDFGAIDQMVLKACGEEIAPDYAVQDGSDVKADILYADNNVVEDHNKFVEASWQVPGGCAEATLVLKANEYTKGMPFRWPAEGYLDYVSGGAIVADGVLNETDGIRKPEYAFYWDMSKAHPAGYTYVYTGEDAKNLYFALDITPDNTNDWYVDFASIILKTADGEREFRVDDSNTAWGASGFGTTSKAPYKHQTYEFAIPKELAGPGSEFALRYYGTLIITFTTKGIILNESDSNNIIGNNITGEAYDVGIWVESSTGNLIEGNSVTNVSETGLYIADADSTGDSVNGNFLCYNNKADLGGYDISDADSNSGDDNTCDFTNNWDDDGTTGCTSPCQCYTSTSPGICVASGNCGCINEALADSNCDTVVMNGSAATSGSSCVIIPSDNKTLDGAGYSITGTDTYGESGVVADHKQNITIKNLQLSDLSYAINIRYCSDVNVTNNTAASSDLGLDFWLANYSSATDNDFSGNGFAGMRLYFSENCIAEGNTLNGNDGDGMMVTSGSNNLITGNDASGNYDYGFYLEDSNYNNVTNNTADSNLGGVLILEGENNIVSGNTIDGNYDDLFLEQGWVGIMVLSDTPGSSEQNIIANNTLDENLAGIVLHDTHDNLVINNTATNGLTGIIAFEAYFNNITENDLTGNRIYSLADIGFNYCNYVDNDSNIGGDSGKPILYLYNLSGVTVSDTDEYSEIILCNVNDSTISNVEVSNPGTYSDGIFLSFSNNNTIEDSTLDSDFAGIVTRVSVGNTIRNNAVSDSYGGIAVFNSMGEDLSDLLNTIIDDLIGGGLSLLASGDEANLLRDNALDWSMLDAGKLDIAKALANLGRISNLYSEMGGGDPNVLMQELSASFKEAHAEVSADPSMGQNTITENTLTGNVVFGMLSVFNEYDTISGNDMSGNGLVSFINLGTGADMISNNDMSGNGLMGFASFYNGLNTISGNTANENGMMGMMIILSFGDMVSGNTANSNGGAGGFFEDILNMFLGGDYSGLGIALLENEGVTLNSNTFCGNALDILYEGDSDSGDENTCDITDSWDDTGTSGCTELCYPLPEHTEEHHGGPIHWLPYTGPTGGQQGGGQDGGETGGQPGEPTITGPPSIQGGNEMTFAVLDSDGSPAEGEVTITKPDGTTETITVTGGALNVNFDQPGTWTITYTDPSGKTVTKTVTVMAAPEKPKPPAPVVTPQIVQPAPETPQGDSGIWLYLIAGIIVVIGGFLFWQNAPKKGKKR